jgi:TonB-dependent receptor
MKNSRTALNGRSAFSITLKNGVSVVALGALAAALAMPALAQDAPAADPDVTEVVVTGQRAQIKTAQKLKKDAEVVVDSVTAVDIGALPDRSVAEALQRVSGLQIQRASEARDPIRMTAEGGGVVIRGLTWVRSETNGRDIFSAKNGRSLSFEDVSADLLSGIDVYKNPSADMIEGGIGGTVNLRTRLPFDAKGRVLAGTLDSTYGDLQEEYNNSFSAMYSDRWDTSIGEIGLLLNYSDATIGNRTDVIGISKYNPAETAAGEDVFVPDSLGWRSIDWTQKRQAGAVAVQWRPNDAWEFSLQAFHSKATPKNTEYNAGFYNDLGDISTLYTSPDNGVTRTETPSAATYTYDSNGVWTGGTVYDAAVTANTRYGEDEKTTTDVSLNARWYVSEKLTLWGDFQYLKSKADVLSNTVFIQVEGRPDVNLDLTGKMPTIEIIDAGTLDDPSTYWYAAAMDHIEKNDATQYSARVDGRYDFDDAGWLKTFKFGARATDRDYVTRQSNYNWGFLSRQYWGGGAGTFLDEAGSGELYTFNNFMHGDVPVPGNVWFPAASLVNQGTQHTYEALAAANTSGWGWTPAGDSWFTDGTRGGINNQTEETKAVYGLFRLEADNLWEGKTIDGNIGVRIVKTETAADGFVVTTAPTTSATCVTNCAPFNNAVTFGAPTYAVTGGTDYTDVLPSLNIRLKYSDQLQFRFAASKAMVRPEMSWLAPYTTLGSSFTIDTAGLLTNYAYTGTGGNPNLKPVEANQYDLTAEWYFAPTSSLTIAIFRKDMENYIYTETGVEQYTNNGVTLDFNVSRYVNGSESGQVDGFEIAYNQFYDFLPGALSGFGVQANYTKINSSGGRNPIANVFDGNQITGANLSGLPLEGMSEDSYNLALIYEKYGISARLAYNWRSKYLYTTSAANVNRPMWADDFGQLDGSVFYSVTPKVKVGIQATNLGQEPAYTLVSSDLSKPLDTQFYSATKTDRRIALVLRAAF